jgi:sulfofructose kinase
MAGNTMKQYDVLGLGCAAIDDLLYVAAYPVADAKQQVLDRRRQCGGLTATALVAAARLGGRCLYAGTLGNDDLSEYVLNTLRQESIDTSLVYRDPTARPIHSVVIVDQGTKSRTLFYDLACAKGAADEWPPEEIIRSARVLLVDHFGVPGMTRAARIARQHGISVVADFEGDNPDSLHDLLPLVDHLILSRQFAEKLTGHADPIAAVRALWETPRAVAIVTGGTAGCWCLAQEWPTAVRHIPAYRVESVDTTGCGDVFHGAYAYALAVGMPLTQRISFAAATAALKATGPGGQSAIPSRNTVDQFIERYES